MKSIIDNRHELVHWHICFKCRALIGCVCFAGWFIENCCADCLEKIKLGRGVQ